MASTVIIHIMKNNGPISDPSLSKRMPPILPSSGYSKTNKSINETLMILTDLGNLYPFCLSFSLQEKWDLCHKREHWLHILNLHRRWSSGLPDILWLGTSCKFKTSSGQKVQGAADNRQSPSQILRESLVSADLTERNIHGLKSALTLKFIVKHFWELSVALLFCGNVFHITLNSTQK